MSDIHEPKAQEQVKVEFGKMKEELNGEIQTIKDQINELEEQHKKAEAEKLRLEEEEKEQRRQEAERIRLQQEEEQKRQAEIQKTLAKLSTDIEQLNQNLDQTLKINAKSAESAALDVKKRV